MTSNLCLAKKKTNKKTQKQKLDFYFLEDVFAIEWHSLKHYRHADLTPLYICLKFSHKVLPKTKNKQMINL